MWLLFLVLAACCLAPGAAFAQITIDGNPADWPAALNTPTYVSTFVRDANNTNDNQFTSGSQDPDAIANWSWSLGNTNDKGDISNAGAVLIGSNLYFFGDRTAVNGDAQIGFWFFKNDVGPIAGGTFSGSHAVGDILVLSNFTNGGGSVQLRVYEWVSTGGGSLNLVGTTSDAAVNAADYTVPNYPNWSYTPKFGTGYVTGSFFEGRVNLASMGLDPCFAAFMLETRNSQSISASLQDLVGSGFNTKPLVSVNSASRCSSDAPVTLTASVTGGVPPVGYSWTGPGGFTSQASSITVSAAGDYTVTVTGANGCSSIPQSGTVTVYASPTASAGGPNAVCQSATPAAITLSGASVGGGATTGAWSILSSTPAGGGALSSTAQTASPASVTFTPTANYVGTVVLRLTTDAPGTCPAATADRTITISPAATVDAGSDQTVCASSPAVTLAGQVGGGATSGTWSGGTGTFSPGATALNATYTPSAAEIAAHTVTLTLTTNDPAGPCGATSDQMTITINPAATVEAGPNQTVCASSTSVTLAGQVGGGATSGTWSGGTGTFNPGATALNATYTPSAAEITAGSVTLTLTTNDPAGPCGATSDQMTITISPIATANAGPNQTVCASSALVQLNGSVGGATGGTWSGGNGTFSPNATTLQATYQPSATEIASGSVTLTLTTTGQLSPCLAASSTMTITINPLATASAGGPNTVCQSATPSAITLSGASVGGGATTGAWSILSSTPAGGGALSSTAQTASPAGVTFTPTANYSGTVVLRLTSNVSGTCPAATADRTITISPAATADAGSDQTVCASSPAVTLAGQVGGGATSGTWSGGTGTFSPGATALNATYTPSAAEITAGSVTLTLTTNDPAGPCGATSDQMTITINPLATASAGGPDMVCQSATPAAITLGGASVGGGATTGAWSILSSSPAGGGTLSSTAQTGSPASVTFTPTANYSGTVVLRLTSNVSGTCPAATADRTITINGLPDAPTLQVDQPTCTQAKGTLTVTSTTTDLTFSLDNGAFAAYPSTGWTVSPGSHDVRAMSLAGCVSAAAPITVDAAPNCLVQHCTLTQGGYGNGNGIICKYPGIRRTELIANMLTSGGDLRVGVVGRSIVYSAATAATTAQCIIDRLPAGGTAAVLPAFGNVSGCNIPATILKNGRFNNVLIGQTLTLALNTRLDNTLAAVPLSATMTSYAALNCNGLDPSDLTGIVRNIPASVLSNLSYMGGTPTVGSLLDLANNALGGASYANTGGIAGVNGNPTLSDISGAAGAINELFDNCRMFQSTTPTSSQLRATIGAPASGTSGEANQGLHAYPNPFSASTTLEFALPQTAHYTLVVYDVKGSLVATVSSGEAQAGVRYSFPLGVALQEGIYMARLVTDKTTQIVRLNLIK